VTGLAANPVIENLAGGFEVIIMDISMPVMDGLQATREIRRLEHDRFDSSSPTTPAPRPALVVALTGLASAKEQKEAFRSGFDSFITKPVRLESLNEILAEWETGSRGQWIRTKKNWR
jgi:CheY-like chemotaxis protein